MEKGDSKFSIKTAPKVRYEISQDKNSDCRSMGHKRRGTDIGSKLLDMSGILNQTETAAKQSVVSSESVKSRVFLALVDDEILKLDVFYYLLRPVYIKFTNDRESK